MSAAARSLCDLLQAAAGRWPQHVATTCAASSRDWQQTMAQCHAAATLFQSLGVERGDRVAFLGVNSSVLYESYFSRALIGAILVPINYRLSLAELVECIDDCAPRLLLVDDGFVEQAAAVAKRCKSIPQILYVGHGAPPTGWLSFTAEVTEILQGGSLCALAPGQQDETAMIFYTGGTTGRAKGVMLSHANLLSNTVCSIPLYRIQPHWRFLVLGPLFHLAAGSRVFTSAALGGHSVILPKFDVEAVLTAIAEHGIHSVTMVPTMLQMLLDHPRFDRYDLSSLQMLAFGAAPMPLELLTRIIERFPGVPIFQTYGMTEAAPILTSLDSKYHVLGDATSKLGSVGRPAAHVELCIVDEEGRPLPPGQTGEILATGDNIMQGYWQLPEQTAEALKDGWYHSGDAGYLDEDGFLYLEGRIKDMIVSGGENVYPIEVENVLTTHGSVKQCAVIGIPHKTWGEAVHAVIVLADAAQCSEQELIDYCRDRIAHYKCPVSVSFREQPMPLSPINKILKSALREPFWSGRDNKLV